MSIVARPSRGAMESTMARGRNRRRAQLGFTYVLLLLMIAVIAAHSLVGARSWTLESRRGREAEWQFRGEQYRAALASYAAQPPHAYPHELSELLEDRRGPVLRRHIRALYPDPMSDAPTYEAVRDGAGAIVGVRSLGEALLMKDSDHPRRYRDILFGMPAATPASSPQ